MQKRSGIYTITNIVTGDLYVGSSCSVTARKAKHFYQLRHNEHGNQHLQSAFNKYGIGSFSFIVIEDVPDRNDLIAREQYWIESLLPKYNKMLVVQGKWSQSPESIEKIKEARAKQEMTPAQLEVLKYGREIRMHVMPQPRLGMTNTDEHNQKIASAHLGMKASEEARQKQRERKLGTKQSPELIQKRAAGMMGHDVSEGTRQKFAIRSKAMWEARSLEERRAVTQKRSPEVIEKQRERMRELGRDPERIRKSQEAARKRRELKELAGPVVKPPHIRKKRVPVTEETKQKLRDARKAGREAGKPHGGLPKKKQD